VVIPVTLLQFNGKRTATGTILQWATAAEQNNSGFEILRSTDGINYNTIAFVNSNAINGTSTAKIEYTYNDITAQPVKLFYKLKQVDKDQRSRMSQVLVINAHSLNMLGIDKVFVNESKTKATVIVNSPIRQEVTLLIYDAVGNRVYSGTNTLESGTNAISEDLGRFQSGVYMVTIISTSGRIIARFVK
jgi:hypothetical protein